MALYLLGPWRPDLTDIAQLDDVGTMRLVEATNIVTDTDCYQPQVEAVDVTDVLPDTCQGAFACSDRDADVNWFAGTSDTLFRISSNTATWSTVGTGYALTADDQWNFVKYGNLVFAAAPTDALQYVTMSAGATFAAVGGAAPRPRHLGVVKNFLIGVGTDIEPQRVQWSALDNPLSWTVDTTTMADFQDLLGPGGWNQGIVVGLAGADAVVLQEHAVWRMLYIGLPLIFQFDPVESARGAVAAGSIIQSAGYAFYYSDDGFYMFDGTTSKPIGLGKVDEFFAADVDTTALARITAIADASRPLVMWSYKSVAGPTADRILVYNWQVGEWTLVTHQCDLIWRALSRHSVPYGVPALACFSPTHAAALFTGATKAATITTAQYQFNPNGRSLITELYPVLESGSPQVELLHRSTPFDTLTSEGSVAINAQGFCPFRVNDRYMGVKSQLGAGAPWSKFRGLKFKPKLQGQR